MVYVLDATGIVSVPLIVDDPNDVFLGMAEMLEKGRATFCNEVVDELERLAKGEAALVWAKSASPSRMHKGAAYSYVVWVGRDYPQLIDMTARDTQESAAVYVVAQALELHNNGREVSIVSEDRRTKPTRSSVREACDHFELRCITLADFLEEAGLGGVGDETRLEYEDNE